MGMIGINGRSVVSEGERRRSYLKMVYENGYHDGYHAMMGLREQAYLRDGEALCRYRVGLRIGRRERGQA